MPAETRQYFTDPTLSTPFVLEPGESIRTVLDCDDGTAVLVVVSDGRGARRPGQSQFDVYYEAPDSSSQSCPSDPSERRAVEDLARWLHREDVSSGESWDALSDDARDAYRSDAQRAVRFTGVDVLPSVPHVEVRLGAGGGAFEIVDERGEVVADPVEGLPLDGIRTRASADRIASRLRAF